MYFYHIVLKWGNQCCKKTKRTTESLSTQLQTSDKNDKITGNNHPNSWIRWTTSKANEQNVLPLSVSTFRYDDRTKSIYSETYIKHIDRRKSSEYGSSLWKKSRIFYHRLHSRCKREKDTLHTHLIIIHPYRCLHTHIYTYT